MAAKMRAALKSAVETIDALLARIDQMKPVTANADGQLRNTISEAQELKEAIAKLLAQKPKSKKRKLAT